MTGKLFAQPIADPRTVAQQELAELTDWLRRLGNGDYEFTAQQREVIETLFAPVDRAELEDQTRALWYAAARAALPVAIEQRRNFLGIAKHLESNDE